MKSKVFILAMALAFAAAFAFADGAQEDSSSAMGEKYGGSLTIHQLGDPGSPAQEDASVGSLANWTATAQEHLILGDHEKWGKMGNGEFPFEVSDYIPDKYTKGLLLSGWDVTPERAELYVKQGVKWYAEHVDFMESRELVAEDIAFDINAFWDNKSWGTRFDGVLAKHAYAKDKYTVVCEFETYNNQFLYYIGWEDRANYSAPEIEDNNPKLWTSQVGTGPFWIESYTPGVNMTFKRNPFYHDTCVIDGETYQKPFLDGFVQAIIPDNSTSLAAFRTGKLAWIHGANSNLWDDFDAIGEGVKMDAYSTGNGRVVWFNTQIEPFSNKALRRAISVGTDRMPIAQLLKSDKLPTRYWPQAPGSPGFVEDADLPASVAELWEYDPDKAKQMLADAGYPSGIQIDMMVRSPQMEQDVAAILQEQWAKIGVDATITVKQPAPFDRDAYAVEYPGVAIPSGFDAANPIAVLSSEGITDAYYNTTGYSNPEFDRVTNQLLQESDIPTQFELVKKASLIIMDDAAAIPLAVTAYRVYWWDWMENFFGEFSLSDGNKTEMLSWVWINTERQAELGHD